MTIIDVRFAAADSDTDAAEARALLSPDERARLDRFVVAEDRRAFAIAHALLRTMLSEHGPEPPCGWRFDVSGSGKPFLRAPYDDLSFSLTHTRGLVACAVTRRAEIGIDVESDARAANVDALAHRFFDHVETAYIRDAPDDDERRRRFIALWTLKEAYVKALGVGLSHPLDAITFALGADGGIDARVAGVPAAAWHFRQLAPAPRFTLAVAVRTDTRGEVDIRIRRDPGARRAG